MGVADGGDLLQEGTVLGGYRVGHKLGAGGMGTVYLARQLSLDRDVALKVLPADRATDDESRQRFLQEGRLAARIVHPGLVAVLDVGQAQGRLYLALELVRGGTLRNRLERDRVVSHELWVAIAESCADVLGALHASGVIHRDIKPENLFVDDENRIRVGDLGIARDLSGNAVKTQAGLLLGTPGYLAPELIRGEQASPASDLYALAVVLYECLVGELPFSGEDVAATIRSHLTDPVPSVVGRRAGLGKLHDSFFRKALDRNPASRLGDARTFLENVREVPEPVLEPAITSVNLPRTKGPTVIASRPGMLSSGLFERPRGTGKHSAPAGLSSTARLKRPNAAGPVTEVAAPAVTAPSAVAAGAPEAWVKVAVVVVLVVVVLALLPVLLPFRPAPPPAPPPSGGPSRAAAPAASPADGSDRDQALLGKVKDALQDLADFDPTVRTLENLRRPHSDAVGLNKEIAKTWGKALARGVAVLNSFDRLPVEESSLAMQVAVIVLGQAFQQFTIAKGCAEGHAERYRVAVFPNEEVTAFIAPEAKVFLARLPNWLRDSTQPTLRALRLAIEAITGFGMQGDSHRAWLKDWLRRTEHALHAVLDPRQRQSTPPEAVQFLLAACQVVYTRTTAGHLADKMKEFDQPGALCTANDHLLWYHLEATRIDSTKDGDQTKTLIRERVVRWNKLSSTLKAAADRYRRGAPGWAPGPLQSDPVAQLVRFAREAREEAERASAALGERSGSP